MTIHNNRKTRLIKFECDCCSDIFDPETTNFEDAVTALNEAGWGYRKKDSVYLHVCDDPSCEFPK